MLLSNTRARYGMIAILFHWLMAILLIGLIILGLYMTRIPFSRIRLQMYGWHKEFGLLALLLVAMRLIWRSFNINPQLPIEMPQWEQFSAHFAHFTFYVLMFVIPISGWLLTSATGLPASFFGYFVLPDFVSPNEQLRWMFTQFHNWMSYCLIGLLCIHVLAALKHHFINRDDILKRML